MESLIGHVDRQGPWPSLALKAAEEIAHRAVMQPLGAGDGPITPREFVGKPEDFPHTIHR